MILVLSEGPRARDRFSSSLVSAEEPQYAAAAGTGRWNIKPTVATIIAVTRRRGFVVISYLQELEWGLGIS
jgi:hypothetical protein